MKRERTLVVLPCPVDPEVVSILDREVDAHPEWPGMQNQRGLLRVAQGRFGEAREAFHEAMYRNPRYAWASLNLAVTLFAMGRRAEAREQIRHKADPIPPARALSEGWMALLEGRPDLAREAIQDLEGELAERTDVRWLRAAASEATGSTGARAEWQQVLADPIVIDSAPEMERMRAGGGSDRLPAPFPGWFQLWLAVSRAEAHLRRFADARRSARMAYLHFSALAPYLNQIALTHQIEGDDAAALRVHMEAMRVVPRDPAAPAAIARHWAARDDLDRAAEYLSHALTLAPRFADLQRFMGQLDFARGRFEDSLTRTRRALALNPRYQLARVDEANALFHLGRWEEAVAGYRRLLADGIVSSDILAHLARCLEAAHPVEALEVYAQSLRLNPREILSHYRLAALCRRLGDEDRSARHWRRARALARDPDRMEPVEALLTGDLFGESEFPLHLRRAS